jgi:hypothetical protein
MSQELDTLFQDYFKIIKPSEDAIAEWRDAAKAASKNKTTSSKKGLRVQMEATHCGMINLNRRFYLPSRMRDGLDTIRVDGKRTKVLKHHNPYSDPVGVVHAREFISTIPDHLQDNKDIKVIFDGSRDIKTALESAKRVLQLEEVSKDGWRGLGYIQITADVFDEKTIEQIVDGRYDAVSTSFASPGQAYCSVCFKNWAREGWCEHEPGKKYQEVDEEGNVIEDSPYTMMALIPGVHNYKEVSFIVFEGDPLVQISIGDPKDSKTINLPEAWEWDQIQPKCSHFSCEFRDFSEEYMMATPDTSSKVLDIIKKLRPEADEETHNSLLAAVEACRDEDGKFRDQEDAELDDETYIQYAVEDAETAEDEIDPDKVAEEMVIELKAMLKAEEISQEEYEAAEAKLSTAQRKKLSKSTFCGPKRSFPVPDCAHVIAARRLIGRYKGPGDKSAILSCVSRRAKALGCGSSKSKSKKKDGAPVIEFALPSCDQIQTLSDEDVKLLFASVESQMIDRQLKVPHECSKCAESLLKAEQSEELKNKAEEQIEDFESTFKVLREELQRQAEDYAEQVSENIDAQTKLYAHNLERLALIGTLVGEYNTIDEAREALQEADIKTEEVKLNDKFDLDKLLEKLRDGMSRDPDGKVKNPSHNTDKNNFQMPEGLSKPAIAALETIQELIEKDEVGQAKIIFDRMNSLGLFSEEITFDSLKAEKEEPAE